MLFFIPTVVTWIECKIHELDDLEVGLLLVFFRLAQHINTLKEYFNVTCFPNPLFLLNQSVK